MDTVKILEDATLHAIDATAELAGDEVTKILADLFKSSALKKLKEAFGFELQQGIVNMENVDKAICFCFAEACTSYRMLQGITDEQKENVRL